MKHGWAFMDAVTRGIEAWSTDLLAQYPSAFHYRGADLRHAVERTLFFRLVNDPDLQIFFDCGFEGASSPLPPDVWSRIVAPFLNMAGARAALPDRAFHKWARNRTGNLLRLGKRSFQLMGAKKETAFLFLAIHPKFVTFMAPIAEAIGPGAAFLATQDQAMENHLAEKDLPYVAVRRAFSSTAPPRPLLIHFPELCCLFDSMVAMLRMARPRAIVVPEGNAPIYEIANKAGQQHGVPVICLQHGAPAYSNPGFRNWNFANVFVWGERFVEPFARHNPQQKFTITGTPASLPPHRSVVADEPIRKVGFFLQKGATVIPPEEWPALLAFIDWMARSYPGIEVIVREHPTQARLTGSEREALETSPNLRFMPAPQYPLEAVLSISDVVVAAASTTLLEAVQAGAIPFIFGTAYPRDFPDLAGAAVRGPDNETAAAAFAALVEQSNLRSDLRASGQRLGPSLFAASGAQGACRIAGALNALVSA